MKIRLATKSEIDVVGNGYSETGSKGSMYTTNTTYYWICIKGLGGIMWHFND